MQHTYELMPNNPATHPVTGDKKIKQEIEVISAAWFSAAHVDRHLGHIERVYNDRPPEVVAPLAQRLLSAVLKLDTVRADAIEKVLGVIRDRGLWVEPAESSGGRTPGIEPAETFEEFVVRNQLTAERLAERDRKASRVEASPLAPHGSNQHKGGDYNCNVQSPAQQGNSSDYLLAKLARDCPEFFQRWKAGEFRSVREACLAAGIIKARPQLVLTKDPFTSAQRIEEQRTQDWIDDLVRELAPDGLRSATESPGEVRLFLEALEPERLRYVLSSLCLRQPHVLEELLADLEEDEPVATWEPASHPVAASEPAVVAPPPAPKPEPAASPAPTNGNGHAAPAAAITELPRPGFYHTTELANALGRRSDTLQTLAARAADGGEILSRVLANAPIKVLVHKGNPPEQRLEVVWR